MVISRRLTKNAGIILFAGTATKVFNFVFIAYAARKLGPHDFGVFVLIGTISFLFAFFGNLGIGSMSIREMAIDRARIEEIFNHIISMRMALIIIFYPVLVVFINLMGYNSEIKLLVYISGLTTIVATLSNSFSVVYVAREKFTIPSLAMVLIAFLTNTANVVILYMGFGLMGLVIVSLLSSLVGSVISCVWIWMKVMKYRFVFDAGVWKNLIAQSMPYALLTFFRQAGMQLNALFLSKLPGAGGEVAIGYYNPALTLCRQAMMLPNSFSQAALPTISSKSNDLDVIKGIIESSTQFLVGLVAFPLVLAVTFFPGQIVSLVFGAQYLPSAAALTIFGWAFALRIYNVPVTVTLMGSRNLKKIIPWKLLIFCVYIISAVPLIMYFSFIGAATAFLIGEFMDTILRNYLLKIICGLELDTRKSLVKFMAPMAVIFALLIAGRIISLGNITMMLFTTVLFFIYLYFHKDFRKVSRYIPGLGGRD